MKAKQQVSGLTKSHVRPEDQEAELVRLHQSTVRDALAIGKLLIEMRNQQPRGEWTAYLESVGVRTGISRASLFRYISAIEKPKKEKNPGPGDFRKAVSPDGHQCMGLLQSWLQKAIRRNDFEEAKYAMEQFYATGFPGAVWTIVRRSASEDIGVAERGVVEEIRALKWAFDQEKHEDGSDDDPRLLHLVHAVLVVCPAKKSRLVDHALICTFEGPHKKRTPPNWALDVHTQEGRKAGKTMADFFDTENPALSPQAGIPDPYEATARKLRIAKKEKTK